MSAQVAREPGDEEIAEAVEVLKLLGDPTRLRLVWQLLHGEHSVNELAAHLRAQPAAVSQHLAKLRMGRIVSARRDGNRIYYSAVDHHIGRLAEQAIFHTEHRVGQRDHARPATGMSA